MRKLIVHMLLLVLVLTIAPTARASTPVSGSIASDTTWTKANSPYLMTDHVHVERGVTLTIEPGVRVEAAPATDIWGKKLHVWGSLVAIGTPEEPIHFTSTDGGVWGGIGFGAGDGEPPPLDAGSTVRHAIIEHAFYALDYSWDSPTVDHVTFRDNGRAIAATSAFDLSITDSIFENNDEGIIGTVRGTISILRNDFWNSRVTFVIAHNTFGPGRWEIHDNDILRHPDNRNSDFVLTEHTARFGVEVNASGNWWGTTDPTKIDERVVDGKDREGASVVTIEPIATSPRTTYVPAGYVEPTLISGLTDSPDPFTPNGDGRNDSTRIRFVLGEMADVKIRIHRRDGSVVRKLVTHYGRPAGIVAAKWNGKNDAGRVVSAGKYTYRVTVETKGSSATAEGTVTLRR